MKNLCHNAVVFVNCVSCMTNAFDTDIACAGKLLNFAARYRNVLSRLLENVNRKSFLKSSEMDVRILKRKGTFQYYLRRKGEKNGKYVPKNRWNVVAEIFQHKYDSAVYEEILGQKALLDVFLEKFHLDGIENVFSNCPEAVKRMVTPLVESRDVFINRWKSENYQTLGFDDCQTDYVASNGIRVRSKSELIIAEKLIANEIPFRYEPILAVDKGDFVTHPDFICLSRSTGEEIMWEHFGMMGDSSYMESAVKKIMRYTAAGYILGVNFLATFESQTQPLAPKIADKYIKLYLL